MQFNIVDFNRASSQIFTELSKDAVGLNVKEFLSDHTSFGEPFETSDPGNRLRRYNEPEWWNAYQQRRGQGKAVVLTALNNVSGNIYQIMLRYN